MQGEERRRHLAAARLYLILTLGAPREGELDAAEAALTSGAIDLVQLRDVSGDEAAMRARARSLRPLCHQHGALLLLNDHPEAAAALDLDGAHVGAHDAPPATARAWLGPDRLLGFSTHDPDEVAAAQALPVDHLGLGPCFATQSKDLAYPPGGGALVARCLPAAGDLPLFPIGGITPDNVGSLVAAGARRAAVGAGILAATDPAEAARRLRGVLLTE